MGPDRIPTMPWNPKRSHNPSTALYQSQGSEGPLIVTVTQEPEGILMVSLTLTLTVTFTVTRTLTAILTQAQKPTQRLSCP